MTARQTDASIDCRDRVRGRLADGACAQTADDLKNDQLTPGDVLVYGMGYPGQRYSPLTQINKENVSRLVPMWGYSMTDNRGAEGIPGRQGRRHLLRPRTTRPSRSTR